MKSTIVNKSAFYSFLHNLIILAVVSVCASLLYWGCRGFSLSWWNAVSDYLHYQPIKGFGILMPKDYTVHGIDVSRYQRRIDWTQVREMEDEGIRLRFAFIKATEGKALVDPYFSYNWEQSGQNGFLRGAYHYLSPLRSANTQAALYLMTVNFTASDLPPVLDVEEHGNQSSDELRKKVTEWLQIVEKQTGKRPILYSNANFYKNYLAGYFDEYPFWIAHYNQPKPQDVGREWHFWQHSDKGNVKGINGPVDFNVFNGTLNELKTMGMQNLAAHRFERRYVW